MTSYSKKFKYLGTKLTENTDGPAEMNYRIQAGTRSLYTIPTKIRVYQDQHIQSNTYSDVWLRSLDPNSSKRRASLSLQTRKYMGQ